MIINSRIWIMTFAILIFISLVIFYNLFSKKTHLSFLSPWVSQVDIASGMAIEGMCYARVRLGTDGFRVEGMEMGSQPVMYTWQKCWYCYCLSFEEYHMNRSCTQVKDTVTETCYLPGDPYSRQAGGDGCFHWKETTKIHRGVIPSQAQDTIKSGN